MSFLRKLWKRFRGVGSSSVEWKETEFEATVRKIQDGETTARAMTIRERKSLRTLIHELNELNMEDADARKKYFKKMRKVMK